MKNIFRLVAFSVFVFGISSCKKTENKDYFEGGTEPVLSASTSSVTLEPGQEANTAIVVSWTNPDYKFTTGISSHDVIYTLEMDTLGANFNSSKKVSSVIAKDLTKTYTVGELNSILGNEMLLQLDPRRDYTMELRVISSIGSAAKLVSNVISFTAKPFAPPPKVPIPVTGRLFLVGSATAGDWNNPVPLPSQEFTKITSTLYEITIPLIGGKEYLFLPENGSWSTKYAVKNNPAVPGLNQGGDFGFNFNDNFPGPEVSGNYKIQVNFQIGKFTVTKL
jgi:hypothetical protein